MKSAIGRSQRLAGLMLALISLTGFVVPKGHCRVEADLTNSAPFGETFTPIRPGVSTEAAVKEAYGNLPLSFEANKGQAPGQVKFVSRGGGYKLLFTSNEAFIALRSGDESGPGSKTAVVSMKMAGANRNSRVEALEETAARSNYFIGNDNKKWRTSIPTYSKVRYRAVYPGIDLIYYGEGQRMEYDFIIAPGARPDVIAMDFRGFEHVILDENGELVLRTSVGALRQHRPIAYQEVNGVRKEVAARYQMKGKHKVGFSVATYDRRKPLIIDPVLSYSTSFYDVRAIAVDAAGNAYVAGSTYFSDIGNFPTTPGAFQPASNGKIDMFISKLTADGSSLIYSTYFGGSNDSLGVTGREEAYDIAVDTLGNAYVTGQAWSRDLPITPGAIQPSLQNESDAFVIKLNATGTSLIYCTYLGGGSYDIGKAIAVDPSGNAYVGGIAIKDFPTTAGSYQTSRPANSIYSTGTAGFVSKLNPTGTTLIYSTYILHVPVNDIAVDSSGFAYVTGTANQTTPLVTATPGAFQSASAGVMDGCVAKLSPDGSGMVYLTFLGGKNMEAAYGIAIDESGNAYVTGTTNSGDFPSVNAVAGRRGSSPVFKTSDGGGTWTGGQGVVGQSARGLAIDPMNPSTLYAQTSAGPFKTTDSGNTWFSIKNDMKASVYGGSVVEVDPAQPATVYADSFGALFKSTDGGTSWKRLVDIVECLEIDASDTAKLYVGCDEGILKSTDGGQSWTHINQGLPGGEDTWVVDIAVNPDNPSTIYAATGDGVFKSTDGGVNWNATTLKVVSNSVAIDPRTHAIYVSTPAVLGVSSATDETGRGNPRKGRPHSIQTYSDSFRIQRSTDGGSTWTTIAPYNAYDIVIDPKTTPSTLYVCGGGSYKSVDGGATWDHVAFPSAVYTMVIDPTNSSKIYAGGQTSLDIFITKLNPTGTDVLFSTYFGGIGNDQSTGIAVDPAGNFYVAGITSSNDFPTTSGAIQTEISGLNDGFIVKFNSNGALAYSTYLGGSLGDGLNSIAVDPVGNVYVAGRTGSADFPITNSSLASGKWGIIAKVDGSQDTVPVSLQVTGASIDKKQLKIMGSGFKMGARILLNERAQPTTNDSQNPAAMLIAGKKVAKKIAPGQTVTIQVENPNGARSNTFALYRALD